jgi:hypothetical protein
MLCGAWEYRAGARNRNRMKMRKCFFMVLIYKSNITIFLSRVLSGQGGNIKVFICALYVSCNMMTLIQFLQNEMDESKNTKRE